MSATAVPAHPLPYDPADEHPTRGEEKGTRAILASVRHVLDTTWQDYGHAVRGVHAKSHGLLEGELRVLDGLPSSLAQGIFARPGATYPVVIRLSTLPGDVLDDSVSTPRGMAMKVSGVQGQRLPGAEGSSTQDFVMASGPPIFVSPDIAHFARKFWLFAITADTGQAWKKALSFVLRGVSNALEAAGLSYPAVQGHLFGLGGQKQSHPLGESYATQTAYRYGRHVAKLAIVPASPELVALREAPFKLSGPNGLREAVIRFFRAYGATWELRVQLRTNPATMPIEDATVAWPEGESPYVPVARITVPPQPGWSESRAEQVDDRLSFSPWHGIEDHRPLGSVNRARKAIYAMSSGFRAEHLSCPVHEPGGRRAPSREPAAACSRVPGREGQRSLAPRAHPGLSKWNAGPRWAAKGGLALGLLVSVAILARWFLRSHPGADGQRREG